MGDPEPGSKSDELIQVRPVPLAGRQLILYITNRDGRGPKNKIRVEGEDRALQLAASLANAGIRHGLSEEQPQRVLYSFRCADQETPTGVAAL
jgi:hypothetical protein